MPLLKDQPPLRRELFIGSLAFLAGLIAMPVLIYLAGRITLGPYGPAAGFGTFLKDFYGGLLQGSAPLWVIVIGPYVLFGLLRILFLIHRSSRV